MLPLAHGALGYLDELLPFFLIAGFAIILVVVAFLSRKTDNTLTREADNAKRQIEPDKDKRNASEQRDKASDHFRLD